MNEQDNASQNANDMFDELNIDLQRFVKNFSIKCAQQYRMTNLLEPMVFNNLPENEQRHFLDPARKVVKMAIDDMKVG